MNKKPMPRHVFNFPQITDIDTYTRKRDSFNDVKVACIRWLRKRGLPVLPMGNMQYGQGGHNRHVSKPD